MNNWLSDFSVFYDPKNEMPTKNTSPRTIRPVNMNAFFIMLLVCVLSITNLKIKGLAFCSDMRVPFDFAQGYFPWVKPMENKKAPRISRSQDYPSRENCHIATRAAFVPNRRALGSVRRSLNTLATSFGL